MQKQLNQCPVLLSDRRKSPLNFGADPESNKIRTKIQCVLPSVDSGFIFDLIFISVCNLSQFD